MIRLTIDAASKIRQRYATLEELSVALNVAPGTAANIRSRRYISQATAQKVADELGEPVEQVATFTSSDEETIQQQRAVIDKLKKNIITLENTLSQIRS